MSYDPDHPDGTDREVTPLTREDEDARVPEPDEPASGLEQEQASAFAVQLQAGLKEGRLPAALTSDARALLETAVAVHSIEHPRRLDPARRAAIVEAALLSGLHAAHHSTATDLDAGASEHGDTTGIISIGRSRALRALPWVSAAAAAAAAVFFFVARPHPGNKTAAPSSDPTELAAHLRSRPTDELIGPIDRAAAGDASARIDAIFADRISGYRELSLSTSRGLP